MVRRTHWLALGFLAALVACSERTPPRPAPAQAGLPPAAPEASAPEKDAIPTLAIADLAATLRGDGAKPLLFQVGFHQLYLQGHIPGSEFLGPGNERAGLDRLRQRVAGLPRDAAIVLYCGCCPWGDCPNIQPTFALLRELGFKNARVLRIDHNFGADWARQGLPVATGE